MGERSAVVFVVDDDASIRAAIASLLSSVGLASECFGSAREFLRDAVVDRPACLVLDVRMPDMSGLELQRALEERGRRIPIVFISAHLDMPQTVRAMKAGAIEFLLKPFRDHELLDAIRTALERAHDDHREREHSDELRSRFDQLSPRERQVFELVVAGRLNKQIAGELGISEVTVKIHRAKVRQKMQAGSLAELVRMHSRLELDEPSDEQATLAPASAPAPAAVPALDPPGDAGVQALSKK